MRLKKKMKKMQKVKLFGYPEHGCKICCIGIDN